MNAAHSHTGTLLAWGAGHTGALGAGPAEDQPWPQPVPGLPPVCHVVAGASSAYAIDASGVVWSWGWDTHCHMLGRTVAADFRPWLPTSLRQMGLELGESASAGSVDLPGVVEGLPAIKALSVADSNVFALDIDGNVWVWGEFLGAGCHTRTNLDRPVKIEALSGIRQISTTFNSTSYFALDANNRVWSWGDGNAGQLGHGKPRSQPVPMPIPSLSHVRSVHSGGDCAYALLEDGTVLFWGNGESLNLSVRGSHRIREPLPVAGLRDISTLFTGHYACIARSDRGETWAVGRYTWEHLLDLRPDSAHDSVARIAALDFLETCYLGSSHGLAISAGGQIFSFGYAVDGCLGNGAVDDEIHAPARIGNIQRASSAAAGENISFAIVPEGSNRA